jgi:hypothetical protein
MIRRSHNNSKNTTTTSSWLLLTSTTRFFSTFAINMQTARAPTGTPRGLLNKMASLGLPPWAAWTRNLDSAAMYRMSPAHTWGSLMPKEDHRIEGIWHTERVRTRVRSAGDHQFIQKILKYPYMRTGVWFSDSLDHWVQVPHVRGAQFAIEKDGGMDNFILKRGGGELRSVYGERLRRNILGRQREIEKNFMLQKSAEKLADKIMAELQENVVVEENEKTISEANAEKIDAVLKKYGLSKSSVANQAEQLRQQV